MAKKSSGGQTAVLVIVVLCLIAVVIIALTGKDENTPAGSGTTDTETELRTTDTAANTDRTPEPTSATDTDRKTETVTEKPHTDTNSSGSTPYVSKNDTRSFQKDLWYMMLVNPDNALPNGFFDEVTDRLVSLKSNKARLMDSRCADDMNAMIDAAKKDGVDLLVCSAYRSYEKQDTNFKNKVEELRNEHKNDETYTEEKAIAETARIIAVPGTSEHHTGLAADIVTPSYQRLNSGFAKTKAFEWLYAHCAEYGFCLRYMDDKQDITKIIYEPWHYRYVGKEAAQIIMSEHLALEEFLEKYGTD